MLQQAQKGGFMWIKTHHVPAFPWDYWRFETLAVVGRVMAV